MDIIISRHGNTFGPQDPVVWTGLLNDLPLVEKGKTQAKLFAQALMKHKVQPSAIYCSSLQRTSDYAEIICETLKLKFHPQVDQRLNEIDYGKWTGLTNEEVEKHFGKQELEAWNEKSQWPTQGNWIGSEDLFIKEAQSFINDLIHQYSNEEKIVVITSNGKIRYYLTLVEGEFQKKILEGSFKVKTGNICKLSFQKNKVTIPYWNVDPSQAILI